MCQMGYFGYFKARPNTHCHLRDIFHGSLHPAPLICGDTNISKESPPGQSVIFLNELINNYKL